MAEGKNAYGQQHVEKDLNGIGADHHEMANGQEMSTTARIQNVLHGQPKEQVIAEVDAFCDKFGLQADREIFRKGALLAQRPHDYQFIDELSQSDKDIIE